jgi:hypothetical protein
VALLGLDYAGGIPHPTAIAAAGYSFVVRYLTPGGSGLPGKLLTQAEYDNLAAHGIAVALNFETTADRMKAGRVAGITDAKTAHAVASALGVPGDRPVYFSADWDASPSDQAVIDEYLRGAASVIGADRVGVYGSYYVVKRALDNGTAKWAWQTGAWSGGQIEPRAHIYQRIGAVIVGGVECDVNEAKLLDFGQHPGPGSASVITTVRKDRAHMQQLPATVMPTDPNSDPAKWPQRSYDVGFLGPYSFAFGCQEWNGRTADATRGFLYLASWILFDGSLRPVDQTFTTAGKGHTIRNHWPTPAYTAPANAVGISLNYAAPGGAYVAES